MINWKSHKSDNESNDGDGGGIKIFNPFSRDGFEEPQGNRIYFYNEVTRESILNLNRQIDDLTKQMKIVQFSYKMESPPPIEIHISSDGGDIFPAVASVDKISENDVPVYTYCEGVIASAATLISVVGKKRFMSKNSCMLIHQVSSQLWGNYMELKDEIQNLDLIMNIIKNIYLKYTKFDKNFLEELLKHDQYLDATKCLEYKLIDSII